jgi:hypothetical protein
MPISLRKRQLGLWEGKDTDAAVGIQEGVTLKQMRVRASRGGGSQERMEVRHGECHEKTNQQQDHECLEILPRVRR